MAEKFKFSLLVVFYVALALFSCTTSEEVAEPPAENLAKVFYENLQLPGLIYEEGMDNPKSPQFKAAADNITNELNKTLTKKPTNISVVKISQLPNTISKAEPGVEADVEMFYGTDTEITENEITTDIQKAIEDAINCEECFFKDSVFTDLDTTNSASTTMNSTNSTESTPTEPAPTPDLDTTPAATPTPTEPTTTPGLCVEGTCGLGSTCEERINKTFICICSTGESYNYEMKICEKAKVFSGNLKMPALKYNEGMNDPKSPEFKAAADKIMHELNKTLTKKPTNMTVVKISQLPNTISKAEPGVEADVDMFYSTDTEITEDEITTDIQTAIEDAKKCSDEDNCLFKDSVFTATPAPTEPAPTPGPCVEETCGRESTCKERYNKTFICICPTGESYNYEMKICEKAKVFPGNLKIPKLVYKEGMNDPKSPEFKVAADNITNELNRVLLLKKPTNITVVQISQLTNSISKAEPGVEADVEMFYSTDTQITDTEINTAFKDEANCDSCFFKNSIFTAKRLCDGIIRCSITTDCKDGNGTLTCECKEHFIRYNDQICVCPNGKYSEDNIECMKCDFGYSGVNCTENWQLILVIVGSVMGILLIIMLIVLLIRSPKKKKPSEMENFGKPPLVFSNGNAKIGVPEIPRATVQTSWNSTGNVEMSQRNTRPNVDRSVRYDDHRDRDYGYQPRSYTNDQMRPQNNPFAPNRPQMNPYDNNRRGNP